MATRKNWASAYARQASADFEAYENASLRADTFPHVCQRLQFLQMASEKICKAHALLVEVNTLESVTSEHSYIKNFLAKILDQDGPKATSAIVERFSALALVQCRSARTISQPPRCRRAGVQIGTVDALIAQLCIGNDLTLLTTDQDFAHAAKHCKLKVWSPKTRARRR